MSGSKRNKNENNHYCENFLNLYSSDEEEIEIQDCFKNEENEFESKSDSIKNEQIEDNNINNKNENLQIIHDPAIDINFNLLQFSKQMKDLEDNLKQSKIEESLKEEKDLEKNYVILKNIEEDTSFEEIQEFFERCGEIKKISLMTNLYSGVQKQ